MTGEPELWWSMMSKLTVGLVILLILMRLLGKKHMSQVTMFDFIYAVLLVGIVEEALFKTHVTLIQLATGLVWWAFLIFTVEKIVQKSMKARYWIRGNPSYIIQNGKLNEEVIRKEHLEVGQVLEKLRENNIFSVQDVDHAILETSGSLSVVPKQKTLSHALINDGVILEKGLKDIGEDRIWLLREITQRGYALNEIYFAEWSDNGLYIQPKGAR